MRCEKSLYRDSLKVLFGVFLTTSISTVASAVSFEFVAERYGLDQAACQIEADQIAKKLTENSSVTLLSATCLRKSAYKSLVSVFMDASEEPKLTTALFATQYLQGNLPSAPINKRYSLLISKGMFNQLKDCLAYLPTAEAIFEKETHLDAITSQCVEMSFNNYAPQVDAWGDSEIQLRNLEVFFYDGDMSVDMLNQIDSYFIKNSISFPGYALDWT